MAALTPNPVLSCWAKGGDDHVVVLIHLESFVIAFVGVWASTSCCKACGCRQRNGVAADHLTQYTTPL
jgi:hypothetical protein